MSTDQRQHRRKTGRLFSVHRGVYAVGHEALTFEARVIAGLRAAGPRAVASHRTAGALYGLVDEPDVIEVTVPPGTRRSRTHLKVHHAHLSPADMWTSHSLSLTAPLRTLLDLAAVLPRAALERACAEAVVRGHITSAALARGVAAARGRRGIVALRAIAGVEAEPTRSELERALRRALREADLPQPQVGKRVGHVTPDFSWPRFRLAVETDGWRTHGHKRAFGADRARDVRLATQGWLVLRFTWQQVMHRPLEVVSQIAQVIAVRNVRLGAEGESS